MKRHSSHRLMILKPLTIYLTLLFMIAGITSSEPVSQFSMEVKQKKIPAPIGFDDIWFYDKDGSKVLPDIDMEWLTVVFRLKTDRTEFIADIEEKKSLILKKAKTLKEEYDELADFLYDSNIAEDACFFRVQKDISAKQLKSLIGKLNENPEIDYVHPVLHLKEKTYAFFNAFSVKWKTGAAKEHQDSLAKELSSFYSEKEGIYRVNVFEIPFFKAVNLFAEDVNVIEAVPYLAEINPSIRVKLSLGINGGNIGDSIPFSLFIAFSGIVRIDPSSIANINLKPGNIQKELFEIEFDPYDYVKAVLKSPITITGRVKFFAPGEFELPPVKVIYTCTTCSDTQVRTAETEKVLFKVSSIVPSKQVEKKLIVPSDNPPPDLHIEDYDNRSNIHLLISLSSLLLALILTGWFIAARKALLAEEERLKEQKPEDLLHEKLKASLHYGAVTPHWQYVKEINSALREYIVVKYKLPFEPFGGSGSIFFDSVKKAIPETHLKALQNFLNESDNIIALELNEYPGINRLRSDLEKFIDIHDT